MSESMGGESIGNWGWAEKVTGDEPQPIVISGGTWCEYINSRLSDDQTDLCWKLREPPKDE